MCAWVLEQLLFLAQDSGLLFLHCITEKHPPPSRTQSSMPAMPTMRAASSCKQGPALLLTKTQKRNLRKRRQRLSCYPAPPLGHHGALSEPTQDDSGSHGRLLQLSERTVGTRVHKMNMSITSVKHQFSIIGCDQETIYPQL